MLSAAGGESQHVATAHVAEPVRGHRFQRGQEDFEMSGTGAGDGFGADGDRPAVLLFDVAIPGMTVIRAEIRFGRRVVVQIITLPSLKSQCFGLNSTKFPTRRF